MVKTALGFRMLGEGGVISQGQTVGRMMGTQQLVTIGMTVSGVKEVVLDGVSKIGTVGLTVTAK